MTSNPQKCLRIDVDNVNIPFKRILIQRNLISLDSILRAPVPRFLITEPQVDISSHCYAYLSLHFFMPKPNLNQSQWVREWEKEGGLYAERPSKAGEGRGVSVGEKEKQARSKHNSEMWLLRWTAPPLRSPRQQTEVWPSDCVLGVQFRMRHEEVRI